MNRTGNDYPMRIVKQSEADYPGRMKSLSGMPKTLYVKGELPREDLPAVAIVGARSCTGYGRNMALEFARILSDRGVQVISGLALGIDGEAHLGAMRGKTPTFAVLASDVEVCYPRTNEKIYEKILETGGGIISEQPPGEKPFASHFPARNRIISALSDLVLVIEARKKSGALITVDFALEQGRSVYAVPGRVGDLLSEGCNHLIAQGAGIACSPESILQELGIEEKMLKTRTKKKPLLSPAAEKLYGRMETTPVSLEQLCAEMQMDMGELLLGLIQLQAEGLIVEIGKNNYQKNRKFDK